MYFITMVLVMAACVFIGASYLTVIYADGPVSAVNPDNSIVCKTEDYTSFFEPYADSGLAMNLRRSSDLCACLPGKHSS